MIFDHIKNISNYDGINPDIIKGLTYISNIGSDVKLGTFWLTDRIKVMITEYKTKAINELGFESHRQFIDIQFPVSGLERIRVKSVEQLKQTVPYDEQKDAAFYSSIVDASTDLIIGNGYFAVFFPGDGHEPQHFVHAPELIKKVTLKIRI